MTQKIHESHADVLQNIEAMIVTCYRLHPQMTDYSVDDAYTALVNIYKAKLNNQSPPAPRTKDPLALELIEQIESVCQWRMNQGRKPEIPLNFIEHTGVVTAEIILRCFKYLQNSRKTWTDQNGRQGYLKYATGFISPLS